MQVIVVENKKQLANEAMDHLFKSASLALDAGRRCPIALSGGSTPKSLYEALVDRARIDKTSLEALLNIDWFFSDERFVAHDHEGSNYFLAKKHFFLPLNLSEESIYKVPILDISPADSAIEYESTIRNVISERLDGIPSFDLIFLGMGADGHTASLFPGTPLVERWNKESTTLVSSTFVSHLNSNRITFTPRLINAAQSVAVLISGKEKAAVVKEIMHPSTNGKQFPIQLIDPTLGHYYWIVDTDAAGM